VIVHHWATGECLWGLDGVNGMYEREMLCEANLLSAFALMIGGALGTGFPMALLIIWLCS
jgi:hypothetical protein